MNLSFLHPWFLVLLVLPAILIVLEHRSGQQWKISVPGLGGFRNAATSWRGWGRRALPLVRAGALTFLVIALARPVGDRNRAPIEGEGIDIAVVVDVSSSMKVEDLEPGRTRLDVVKEVVHRFVEGRHGDRIGLIAFARHPITLCPFTMDTKIVASFVDRLEPAGLTDEDGTAIGIALAQASRRLKKSTAKSRVVVLLTDGANNVDDITPEDATRLAATLGIRVYTIMAGRDRVSRLPRGPSDGNSESKPLVDIARATGGRFYRAEDARALADIYTEIGSLEKTKFDESRYETFTELFRPWALGGMLLMMLAGMLDHTWLRRLP